jgi:hypothetical protein
MNKLATAFKFGTVALVVAAAVQCSSYSAKDVAQDAGGKIHEVKDALQGQIHDVKDVSQDASQENAEGNTVATRFNVPVGYSRKAYTAGTFGNYLQDLPLKPQGTLTKYYNGEVKDKKVAAAVIDMSVGNRDLQQCADAIMRLRAEWLFSEKRFLMKSSWRI